MKTKKLITCQYRNCGCSFIGRPDQKYCNHSHRRQEWTYIKRENISFEKEKLEITNMLMALKSIDPATAALYNSIYGK